MARDQAAARVVGLTANQRQVLRNLIARALRQGWSDDVLQARIKEKVGLGEREANAVEAMRAKMLNEGMAAGDVNREARIYADRLRSQRAIRIGRYETQKALLDAQRALWAQMQEDGEVSRYAVRVMRVHKDERLCPVCRPLNGRRASLRADGGYEVQGLGFLPGPPFHPNCRCWEVLSDEGIAKALDYRDLWG